MNEGTKISDNLNFFNTLMCQCASIGVKFKEEDKVVMLLCLFPEYWNHLVTSISFSMTYSLEFDFFVGVFFFQNVF